MFLAHRPSPSSVHTFVHFSETPGPIFFKCLLEPFVNGGLKIYTNGFGPLIKITLHGTNLLLQNEESFKAESWYIALGTQGLPG